MPKKPWSANDEYALIEFFNQGAALGHIAKAMGRTLASVSEKTRQLRSIGWIRYHEPAKEKIEVQKLHDAYLSDQVHEDFLKVTGDAITASDWHVPFQSKPLIAYLIKIAEKFKIKKLIINGDFFNMDSFSSWVNKIRGHDWTQFELRQAAQMFTLLLDTFETIYITKGNHEDRFIKVVEGQLGMKDIVRMVSDAKAEKRLIGSDYDYCLLNNSYLVIHPKTYGGQGGKVPAEVAAIKHKHVISGHNHLWGIQFSKDGKYMGIDQGMAGDPKKIDYHQTSVSTAPAWQNGFTMIKDNYPYLFNLKMTDWSWWLK